MPNDARAIDERPGLQAMRQLHLRLVAHPWRASRAILLEAGAVSFAELHQAIESCRETGQDVLVRADVSERVAKLLGGPEVEGRTCLFVRGGRAGGALADTMLWALDRILGLVILAMLLPLMALIAVVVKGTSGGPALFRSQAVGRDGERFVWSKFRTMRSGSDDGLHREAARRFITGDDSDFRMAGVYKIQRDDRVTSAGRFLRRHSLDELPQILEVAAGRMSLVGPRPCLPYEWDLYAPHHRRRLEVKPGMTGLWQTRGRSRVDFEEMVLMDRCWAWNRSVPLYLRALARTAGVVVKGEGGY